MRDATGTAAPSEQTLERYVLATYVKRRGVSYIAFPVLSGEVAFMLWLLIMGAKPQPLDAAAF